MNPPITLSRLPFSKSLFLFISLLTLPFISMGQGFGVYPPGLKWMQVNTPVIRIIYPQGLDSTAQRVANTIKYIDQNNRVSIGNRKKKLELILNNFGVESNGYVTLSPFRSEFFAVPSQNTMELGPGNWIDLLSVHEYRHALQYMNLNSGWFRVASLLFGQNALSAMMNLTVPNWFFEGDAVVTETALTNQGRGRLPAFFKDYRAIWLEDDHFTYQKARNCSFDDLVPDHYRLGYLLCSYGREQFGNDLWKNVNQRTSRLNGLIYPFSQGVQVLAGLKTDQLYNEAREFYRDKWVTELKSTFLTEPQIITKDSRFITFYHYPKTLENGNILALKSSYAGSPAFVEIDPKAREKRITSMGLSLDNHFSTNGSLIVWSDISWHPRYASVSYSDVVVFDMKTGTRHSITTKQRFFSPDISKDGSRIVVLESSPNLKYHLKILDVTTGEVIQTIDNPENYYFTYPKWSFDGSSIISSLRREDGKMGIIRIDPKTGETKILLPFINQAIGPVSPSKDMLLFSAGYSGIDNVYCIKKGESKVYQLSSVKYGAYEPVLSTDGTSIIFSESFRYGHRLSKLSFDSCLWEVAKPIDMIEVKTFKNDFLSEEKGAILNRIPKEDLSSKKYRPGLHLFKFHSWNLTPSTESLSAYLYSDNVLNQFHFEAGYDYYWNEASSGYSVSASYGGWFPILSLTSGKTFRTQSDAGYQDVHFAENTISLDAEVPFDFSHGNYIRNGSLSVNYDFTGLNWVSGSMDGRYPTSMQFSWFGGSFDITNRKLRGKQQITTPFGQALQATWKQSVGNVFAMQFIGIGDLAFRGLLPTHSFVFTGAFKYEYYHNDYLFNDYLIYPRGYSIPSSNYFVTFQSNYHFPLLYPDFGLIGIVYLQRIRANLFMDFGTGDIVNIDGSYPNDGFFTSTGGELIFDTQWLNFIPISLGFRTSLLLNRDMFNPDRIINIEFFIPILRL